MLEWKTCKLEITFLLQFKKYIYSCSGELSIFDSKKIYGFLF